MKRSKYDKPGVGYSIEYARRAGTYGQEAVKGELAFDLKTIAKRVIENNIESKEHVGSKAMAMTVGTIARRELKSKYVDSGKMSLEIFNKVVSQVTDKTIEYMVDKMKSKENSNVTKEDTDESVR